MADQTMHASLTAVLAIALSAFAAAQQPAINQVSSERAALLARFEKPQDFLPRSGAGGTEWDACYRTFIQTDEAATSKGLPSHADAARQILADAAKGAANVERHLGFVLHIKHFSQAYRPESATADLKRLYEDLVDVKLGARPRDRTSGPVASGQLADALQKAGVSATCRIGPDVGKDAAVDNRAIVAFLAQRFGASGR